MVYGTTTSEWDEREKAKVRQVDEYENDDNQPPATCVVNGCRVKMRNKNDVHNVRKLCVNLIEEKLDNVNLPRTFWGRTNEYVCVNVFDRRKSLGKKE